MNVPARTTVIAMVFGVCLFMPETMAAPRARVDYPRRSENSSAATSEVMDVRWSLLKG
jgi:hypothetical protein